MYQITRKCHIRLEGGKSVVLQEGPRGVVSADPRDPEAGTIDLDANLRKLLPDKTFQALIKDGTIIEE